MSVTIRRWEPVDGKVSVRLDGSTPLSGVELIREMIQDGALPQGCSLAIGMIANEPMRIVKGEPPHRLAWFEWRTVWTQPGQPYRIVGLDETLEYSP